MTARTSAVLVCALSIAFPANQQPSGQRPVFRAGSILVSVDAYPRRDGRVIEGLTKNDFEVFEDGNDRDLSIRACRLSHARGRPARPDVSGRCGTPGGRPSQPTLRNLS